ncbi:MAG: ADP-ribosylglycohydrolase family protein [Symploca sp. SIO2C1]|nr:ADP-ribosylglycohydrolase family protein [Symploca sp. SIO2C1]
MRYSLLSRFRGALLGSLVGEILGNGGYQGLVLDGSLLKEVKSLDNQQGKILSAWHQIAVCGTKSLINCGRLDLEDWLLQINLQQSSLLAFKNAAICNEVAVTTLPIILFFHENEAKLKQHLLQAAAIWQEDTNNNVVATGEALAFEGVLAIAFAIALALTEKLNPDTLIPQILAYLGTTQTPMVKQLTEVQTLLEQSAGLNTTLRQLRRAQSRLYSDLPKGQLPPTKPNNCPYTSIALAFYCFLSTPEDFRLCVTRAVRTSYQPQTTAALTGALSGVYNSIINIPIGWRLATKRIGDNLENWQLVEHLFAVWLGVYELSVTRHCEHLAVADPCVIQQR